MSKETGSLTGLSARIGHLMMKERMMSRAGQRPDKKAARSRLLGMIKAHPEKGEKELARLLGRRMEDPEEYLEKLVCKGFLERTGEGVLTLTDRGREEAAEWKGPDAAFDCLSDSEKETMRSFLERIADHLEQQLGADEEEDFDFGFPGGFGAWSGPRMGHGMQGGCGRKGHGRGHRGFDPRFRGDRDFFREY